LSESPLGARDPPRRILRLEQPGLTGESMPNQVINTRKVMKGDPREIFEFVRTEKSVFDFNNLIPMPESICMVVRS
jgi:hypothetical protein